MAALDPSYPTGDSKTSDADTHTPRPPAETPPTPSPAAIPHAELSGDSASIGSSRELISAAEAVLKGGRFDRVPPKVLDQAETKRIYADIVALRDAQADALVKAGGKAGTKPGVAGTPVERMLGVLRKAAYQPNIAGFNDPALLARMAAPLELAVREGRPIAMVIPVGGGKVSVPLKTGASAGVDVADMVAAAMLDALGRAASVFHKPGVVLIDMPDLGLHTGDTASPIERHYEHMRRLRAFVRDVLNAERSLLLPDPLDHLPDEWLAVASELAIAGREKFLANPDGPLARLARAMVLSINTASEARTFEEHILMYAALSRPDLHGMPTTAIEAAEALRRRAHAVVPGYVGTSEAIRKTRLLERLTDDLAPGAVYFRLTVHPKAGEPRPFLIPSGRLALKPGVLPMHSVGARSESGGLVRLGNTWELVARVNRWQPVHGPHGFMFYDVPIATA